MWLFLLLHLFLLSSCYKRHNLYFKPFSSHFKKSSSSTNDPKQSAIFLKLSFFFITSNPDEVFPLHKHSLGANIQFLFYVLNLILCSNHDSLKGLENSSLARDSCTPTSLDDCMVSWSWTLFDVISWWSLPWTVLIKINCSLPISSVVMVQTTVEYSTEDIGGVTMVHKSSFNLPLSVAVSSETASSLNCNWDTWKKRMCLSGLDFF